MRLGLIGLFALTTCCIVPTVDSVPHEELECWDTICKEPLFCQVNIVCVDDDCHVEEQCVDSCDLIHCSGDTPICIPFSDGKAICVSKDKGESLGKH